MEKSKRKGMPRTFRRRIFIGVSVIFGLVLVTGLLLISYALVGPKYPPGDSWGATIISVTNAEVARLLTQTAEASIRKQGVSR